mmetsp:Transcript_2689/g.4207  ORF Transcript_2689/g.4207 Transcript_2689/m.4207 type:complete len:181 (-) Transcript_2689:12-554(-)
MATQAPEREQRKRASFMHPRVWSVAVVLFAALVFSALSVSETEANVQTKVQDAADSIQETGSKLASDADVKLKEAADAAYETKEDAGDKLSEIYNDLSNKFTTDNSWRAKYDRAYEATREQLENANLVKSREQSVTDKLRSALTSMESRVDDARKKFTDSYEKLVSPSVEQMRESLRESA